MSYLQKLTKTTRSLMLLTVSSSLIGCGGALLAIALSGGGGAGAATGTLAAVASTTNRDMLPAAILPFTAELTRSAISPDGSKMYALDSFHNTLNVYNLSKRILEEVIDIPNIRPSLSLSVASIKELVPNLIISPDGKRLYLTSPDNDQLIVVDTSSRKVVKTIDTGGDEFVKDTPVALAVSKDNKHVYIVNQDSGSLSIVDAQSFEVSKVATGSKPIGVAVQVENGLIYVANKESSSITVIDPVENLEEDTISLDNQPTALTITPDGQKLLVVLWNGSFTDTNYSLAILDTKTSELKEIKLEGFADLDNTSSRSQSIITTPDGKFAFMASVSGQNCRAVNLLENSKPHKLTVIDLESEKIETLDVEPQTTALAINRDSTRAFASGMCPKPDEKYTSVSDIDISAFGGQGEALTELEIKNQKESTGLQLAPDGSKLYVMHANAITVVDTGDTISQETIAGRGPGPFDLAFNSLNDVLLTANAGAGNVSWVNVVSDEIRTIESSEDRFEPAVIATSENVAYVGNTGSFQSPGKTLSKINVSDPKSPIPEEDTIIKLFNVNNPSSSDYDAPISIAMTPDGGKYRASYFGEFTTVINNGVGTSTNTIVTNDDFFFETEYSISRDGGKIKYGNIGSDNPVSSELIDMPLPVDLVYQETEIETKRKLIVLDYLGALPSINDQNYTGPTVSVFNITVDNNNITQVALDNDLKNLSAGSTAASAMVLNNDASRAFVVNSGDRQVECNGKPCEIGNTVTVVDLLDANASEIKIPVGEHPLDIVKVNVNEQEKTYVPAYFSNNVTVINMATREVIETIPVGKGPVKVIKDDEGMVYIANSIDGTITVIDSADDTVNRTINLNL